MLTDSLQNDLKQAQLGRDGLKVSTLRLLLSEVKNAEIAKGSLLSDDEVISVIQKEAKKRRESIESFKSGARDDLAQKETDELGVLQSYLPAQLTTSELTKIIEETITESGATSIQDMGKVMGSVMSKVAGKADGGMVSQLVKERLAK